MSARQVICCREVSQSFFSNESAYTVSVSLLREESAYTVLSLFASWESAYTVQFCLFQFTSQPGVCVHSFAARRRESAYTVSARESAYTVSPRVGGGSLRTQFQQVRRRESAYTVSTGPSAEKRRKNLTNQYFFLKFFAPVLLHACQCLVTYHGISCSSDYLTFPLHCIVYSHL